MAVWPEVAAVLRRVGYRGPLCLTAEYRAADELERLLAADLAFARSLFAPPPVGRGFDFDQP